MGSIIRQEFAGLKGVVTVYEALRPGVIPLEAVPKLACFSFVIARGETPKQSQRA